jgi:Ulp1 family protease
VNNITANDNNNFYIIDNSNNSSDSLEINNLNSNSSPPNNRNAFSQNCTSSSIQLNSRISDCNYSTAVVNDSFILSYHDLHSTLRDNWFNDNIIDFYFNLISSFNNIKNIVALSHTLFSGFLSKSTITLKASTKKRIGEHQFILVPTLFNKHWRVLIIDKSKKEIIIYDSLNLFNDSLNGTSYLPLVQNFISILMNQDKTFSLSDWGIHKIYKPSQDNAFDCGPFICLYTRNFFINTSSSFSQNLIPDFRKHLLKEIFESKLFLFDFLDIGFDDNAP